MRFLPCGGVHAGLAADRGIEHGEQGGGHLEVGHAAHVGRGDESREVARDAAAERHDAAVAAEARREQLVGEPAPGLPRLRPLARREGERLPVPAALRRAGRSR